MITSKSRISIRYTTDPADLGYGGTPTDWRSSPPAKVTSPRLALAYIAGLRRTLGGADFALDLRCRGESVSRDDLLQVVSMADARAAGG